MFQFHHVGVGTTDFEGAIKAYEALGYKTCIVVDDPGLCVRVALLRASTGPLVEIVSPLGSDHPLKSLIARKVLPSPYHTCYSTADIVIGRERLFELGYMPLGDIRPAVAFDGARIAYQYHPAIGLLELVENPPAL